jgi:hypothetical protein
MVSTGEPSQVTVSCASPSAATTAGPSTENPAASIVHTACTSVSLRLRTVTVALVAPPPAAT